jgi:WD40 repeat protein
MTAELESPCPDLAALESVPLALPIKKHVEHCAACQLVIDVVDQVQPVEASGGDCHQFDALLAARGDGTLNAAGTNLLERHLASCGTCRAVAETLSPIADAHGDHAKLPSVDPASYALGLEVGRGGMGRVLAARDLRVGRPVAVKELLGRSPQLAARFEREARVTARLQHPGIVPIYEIGRWPDGTPFYSMRMVEGRMLREAIERAGTLPARLALLPAVIAACEAVAFAHSQRVIHRDLTPSNVLVGAYGETVVIDWGLAKDLSGLEHETDDPQDEPYRSEPAGELTRVGAVVGTVAYMPPEQARADAVDERADVYALGAILYHLLAGKPPFRGSDPQILLDGPPPPIDAVAPHAPRDLVSIVEKAMARDPEARYPSARELADELKRFQTGRIVEAHAYSFGEHVRRFVRRNRAAVLVTALAALVLASVGALAISRVLRSRAEAQVQVRNLLEEEGRIELLAGNPLRALAYLHAAYDTGTDTPTLRFLLANAMRGIELGDLTLDCGGNVRSIDLSPDGSALAAACTDVAKLWKLDGTVIATLGPAPGGFVGARYSHDGKTIATWGADGIARLWDTRSGALRASLVHGDKITFTRFTPDDRTISTSGHDGNAILWDARGGKLRTINAANGLQVYGELSHDGTLLLTSTFLGDGTGWEVATGKLRGGFKHGSFILGGDLSPDGKYAATCGIDRLAKLWDLADGHLIHTFPGHTDVVWKCVFSPDGKLLLTGGHDGTANIWNLETGTLHASANHGGIVWTADFAPDGKRIATTGVDGRIKIWDTGTGGLLSSRDSFGGKGARFTLDGQRLIAMRGDGRVQIWQQPTGAQSAAFSVPAGANVLAVSDDGSRTAIDGDDDRVKLHTAHGKPIAHAQVGAPIAMSPTAFAAISDTSALVLDLATGRTRATVPLAGRPDALALGGDLLAVTHGETTQFWDLARATVIATVPGATEVLISEDGRRALAWKAGSPIAIWDLRPARKLAEIAVTADHRPLGFAAAGARVAIADGPDIAKDLTVYDATSGARMFAVPDTAARSLDPSGTYLTTIGADQVVSVHTVVDGTRRHSFVGDSLLAAQVDPSGSLIAGIGAHGTAAIVTSALDGRVLARWRLESGPPLISQDDFKPPAASARWSRDGATIVTQSLGIAVWNVASKRSRAEIKRLVNDHVPWRVVRGRLAWVEGRVRGRVLRAGQPVAGARVVAEIRKPPDPGAAPHSWETTRSRINKLTATTDEDGAFSLTNLFPGLYTLTASSGATTAPPVQIRVSVEDAAVTIELP